MVGDIGPVDTYYEPRYIDANGIARFVRENTFGTKPSGEREIVVFPLYETHESHQRESFYIKVPKVVPWNFKIFLD